MLRRALSVLAVAVAAISCDALHPVSEADFQMTPPLASTYLRYRVRGATDEWTREFVVGRRDFAELRDTGGRPYVLGLDGSRAWLRVGARTPVEIDGPLAADERTEAAWIGMRFAEPAPGERFELESCHAGVCTLVYMPHDGHALWVDVDRRTRRPVSFQWIARDHAIESCDGIEWSDVDGTPAVAAATCSAIVDHVGRETLAWTLEDARPDPVPPEWARVSREDILPLPVLRDAASFDIADPSSRVYVPVEAGGSPPLRLVLDTGSPVTVLARRVVDALGVVPSPDPPLHVRPPWLPEGTYDAVIVDRMTFGDVELHGVNALVPRDDVFDGDEAGLLGMDLLSRFVVDVDGPASTLRIWPRNAFPSSDAFTDLPYWGSSRGQVVVTGAVDELGPMPVMVDTGAPLNVVVGGPAMHVRHPHHRGEDLPLREDDTTDYESEVDGFHLGPFHLPRMPAIGHDRRPDLPFLDEGGALVGLGVLRHFRVVVDATHGELRLAPGPSYAVLTRLGVEIDDRNGAPTISRVVSGERDWRMPFKVGDVVRSVDGRRVASRQDALAALAATKRRMRLVLLRRGNLVPLNLALR